MFTQIQIHNHKALETGAALKKLILEWLQQKILEQMHTIDLTGKSDAEMIDIITRAGRTAENWDEAKKSLGPKKAFPEKSTQQNRPFKKNFQRSKFKQKDSRPAKVGKSYKTTNTSRKMYA